MSKFTILIGLPGCGKSTYASKLDKNVVTVSSDSIREEMYGDESVQTNPEHVFTEARKRIVLALNSDKNTVLDATNINKKLRKTFIRNVVSQVRKNKNLCIEAIWFPIPYEECLKRNKLRDRQVPEQIIRKMYMNFCPPNYDEGYDEIHINWNGYSESKSDIHSWIESVYDFDQQNPHHTLSLGEHCKKCAEYVKEHSDSKLLYHTALIHDCGKPFTASHMNGKGEIVKQLHYYQHHCVGSYDAAAFLKNMSYSEEEIIYGCNLIWMHMHPLREWKNNDKKKQKDLQDLSEQFIQDLNILHEGDLMSH